LQKIIQIAQKGTCEAGDLKIHNL